MVLAPPRWGRMHPVMVIGGRLGHAPPRGYWFSDIRFQHACAEDHPVKSWDTAFIGSADRA